MLAAGTSVLSTCWGIAMIIDAHGPDGNAFAIMARVKQVLNEMGRTSEWEEVRRRMMAGNYETICSLAEEITGGTIQVVNRPAPNSRLAERWE